MNAKLAIKEFILERRVSWHKGRWLYATNKKVIRHWFMWKYKTLQLWLFRKRYKSGTNRRYRSNGKD